MGRAFEKQNVDLRIGDFTKERVSSFRFFFFFFFFFLQDDPRFYQEYCFLQITQI